MKKAYNSQCVINIVPPRELWIHLQSLRTMTIPEARCGPHISFIDPFVELEYYPQAAQLLQQRLSELEPFQMTLEKLNHFEHKASATLYLEPKCEPINALDILYHEILKLFPECNDTSKKSKDGKLVPHFTIGKFKTKSKLLQAYKTLQETWKPLSFVLKEIYLLYRNGTDPFEVKGIVYLGKNISAPHFGPGSVTDSSSQLARTLVICGISLLKEEELLQLSQEAGFSPIAVEIIRNPDGKVRPIGLLEFSNSTEAETALQSWNFQPSSTKKVYLKPLSHMVFPDVIEGSCSLHIIQSKLNFLK